ncbi:MAG: response regulator transcription factor [Rhodospirillales bacterium]|nr:response regulator transcription factor [Rhodospirillales bacterium]
MTVEKSLIHLVDDEAEIRSVYKDLLENRGYSVQTYESAEDFLGVDLGVRTGCILLDFNLPKMNGLELQAQLKERPYQLPIIFMSGQPDIAPAVDSVLGGAIGYIQKPATIADVIAQIQIALCQSEIIFKKYQSRMLLTKREAEIADHLMLGKTSKIISDDVGISIKTVEFHRTNIMRKLAIHGIAELTALLT